MTAGSPKPSQNVAVEHLPGMELPALEFPASDGTSVALNALPDRTAVFVFPGIGGPADQALMDQWMALPGAYGCTAEACDFRDRLSEFDREGVAVLGLSAQSPQRLRQAVDELQLPYALLSDEQLRLADELRLPTFELAGTRYFERLTMIVNRDRVEATLVPVSAANAADQALRFLAEDS